MSNPFIPNTEVCVPSLSGKLNPSFFPVGSAQHLDLNYNILPFLCDLLKAATDSSIDPLLTEPPQPFDLTPYTNFDYLSTVGDPRISLGETMTQTYIYFLPRVITQTEVRQAGGTQVIDKYICTADGTPIKVSETIPAMLSLDLTGQTSYQYGAITVPPVSATFDDLMTIIEPTEVSDFVVNYVSKRKSDHAKDFVRFINRKFDKATVVAVDIYELTKFIIVNLKEGNKTTYLKYYYDVAHEVAFRLKKKTMRQHSYFPSPENLAQALAFGSEIPNYENFKINVNAENNFYNKAIKDYTSTPDENFSNMFRTAAGTPSMEPYIEYFKKFEQDSKKAVVEIPVVYRGT
jgi:hypothetical protein